MLEDYTYNLVKGKEGILQAHMLEICPTIADGPISIKCQPLSMGDREDPARLVFTSKEGPGVAVSMIDLGQRFRLLINEVDCKKVEKPMPKLPVATNFWVPQPDLYTHPQQAQTHKQQAQGIDGHEHLFQRQRFLLCLP